MRQISSETNNSYKNQNDIKSNENQINHLHKKIQYIPYINYC